MGIEEFESLLAANRTAVERFVRFRLRSQADADDVLQDVYLTAWRKFPAAKEQRCLQSVDTQRRAEQMHRLLPQKGIAA